MKELLLLVISISLISNITSFKYITSLKNIHKQSINKYHHINQFNYRLNFSANDSQTPNGKSNGIKSNGNNKSNGIFNEYSIARLKAEAAKLRAEAALLEAEQQEVVSKAISDIFKRFDRNQDGSISVDELRSGLESELRLSVSDELVNKLLKSFDESGDGLLQLNEFRSIEEFRKKLDALVIEERQLAEQAAIKASEAMKKAKEAAERSTILAELINDKPPTISDRLVSVIAYLIPLFDSFQYGKQFLANFGDNPLTFFIAILYNIYVNVPFSGLVAFFALTILSNNLRVNKLIRFNIQQAILIDIAMILPGILGGIVTVALPLTGYTIPTEIGDICSAITFLTFSAAILYSFTSSLLLGQIPNQVPFISKQVEKRIDSINSFIDKEINQDKDKEKDESTK